jgi:hypothetical protein
MMAQGADLFLDNFDYNAGARGGCWPGRNKI